MTEDPRQDSAAIDGPDPAAPDGPVDDAAPDGPPDGGGTAAADQPAAAGPTPDAGATPPAAEAATDAPEDPEVRKARRSDRLAAALIGVLTLLLGFAFAVQVRSVGHDQDYAGAREEDLVRILDDLNAREERLREQLTDQRVALQQLSSSDSRSAAALEEARRQSEAIGILNGTIAAHGPGLVMTIRDPEEKVRVNDILDAIQELRGAGAETMQIDGIRVAVSTAVTGKPGSLMVDGHPISAPYEVLVIGEPQYMETAMNIPGGVVQHIENLGGTVTIAQSSDVVVDALRPLDTPQYASPETDD
jgi:uncharacterized protein YlxW (UPF0749 family)